jgi:hypothetical protein
MDDKMNVNGKKSFIGNSKYHESNTTPWPLVRKRTIPTERPPLVGEFNANFCD